MNANNWTVGITFTTDVYGPDLLERAKELYAGY